MRRSRRSVLGAAVSLLLPGCTEFLGDDPSHVRLVNLDSESHDLQAKFRGSADQATRQTYEASLQPDGGERMAEPLRLSQYGGSELVIRTRIDEKPPEERTLDAGFSEIGVVITDETEIDFELGTA